MEQLFSEYKVIIVFLHVISAVIWVGGMIAMRYASHPSFLEIESFMRTTGTNLNHWEVLALRTLSLEYIIQSHQKDISDMPPFLEVDEFTYLSSLK